MYHKLRRCMCLLLPLFSFSASNVGFDNIHSLVVILLGNRRKTRFICLPLYNTRFSFHHGRHIMVGSSFLGHEGSIIGCHLVLGHGGRRFAVFINGITCFLHLITSVVVFLKAIHEADDGSGESDA